MCPPRRLPADYVGKTYAQACANLCCTTPQECAQLGNVRLVGGQYPWEGIVQMTWRDDPMAVLTPDEDSDDTGVVERNFTVCPTSIYGPSEAMVRCARQTQTEHDRSKDLVTVVIAHVCPSTLENKQRSHPKKRT